MVEKRMEFLDAVCLVVVADFQSHSGEVGEFPFVLNLQEIIESPDTGYFFGREPHLFQEMLPQGDFAGLKLFGQVTYSDQSLSVKDKIELGAEVFVEFPLFLEKGRKECLHFFYAGDGILQL